MANIAAAQNGDFSATSTWTGGVVPGSGDVAYANNFTVTISDTRTVQAISNAAATGITVGGSFSLLNGCNLTCTASNGILQGAVATSCVTTPSLGVGTTATVNASFTNMSTTNNASAIQFSSSGTLNCNGNITASSLSAASFGISATGTGNLNITGNLTSGATALQTANALNITGGCIVSVVGNVAATSAGGFTNCWGIFINSSNALVTVVGSVTGGGGTLGGGGINNTSGTLTVNGTCQSSTTQPAIGSGGASQITRLSGPFLLGSSGNINPVQAQSWRWAPTQIPTYMEVVASNGSTKRNIYTADNMPSGGYPTAANVRSSTVYGPSSEFTGTMAVPAAGSVALGVAVDNTVGTAILSAADVRTAVGLASGNLDVQLAPLSGVPSGRLANVATVDTTGAQIRDSMGS